MKYSLINNIHIVEIPVKDFKIVMYDKAKKSSGSNTVNAGFFGNFSEGKDKFTLPVGNLVCDYKATSKWTRHYCEGRGKFNGDKFTFNAGGWNSTSNSFYNKSVSTLIINNGKAKIEDVVNPPACDYAIAGIPIMKNGADVKYATYVKGQGWDASPFRATWHTFVGLKNNNEVLYIIGMQTKTSNMVLSAEAFNKFKAQGFVDVIKMDGGGSFYLNVNGKAVASTAENRRINTVFSFAPSTTPIPEKPIPPKQEENDNPIKPDNTITKSYLTKNPCYTKQIKCNKTKMMLHSTGTPGLMYDALIRKWDSDQAPASVECIIDDTGIYQTLPLGIKSWHCGRSANSTHVACEICEPQDTRLLDINWKPLSKGGANNTLWAITMLQKELMAWGYNPNGVDGSFGSGCDKAVRDFQKDKGLVVDGSVGLRTLHALQKRTGSLLKYDVKKNEEYFNNVYNKAVYYFATTLKEIGGKAEEVICHSEGYKLGIASNHADVMHWFPVHGKSMDTFRADVAKAMLDEVKPIEPEKPKPIDNNVTKAQKLLNTKFNSGLAVDGSWGPACKKALIKAIQQTLNIVYNRKLVVDGSWGPASQTACPDLIYHVVNVLVYCLQLGLFAKGFDIEVDGSYGRGTESVVKSYQASCGIKANGIAGRETFTKLVS